MPEALLVFQSISVIFCIAGYIPMHTDRELRINRMVWSVWIIASIATAFNQYMTAPGQLWPTVFFVLVAVLDLSVVIGNWRQSVWGSLPLWQKLFLPLLIASPILSQRLGGNPGLIISSAFNIITTYFFCESIIKGQTKESLSGFTLFAIASTGVVIATSITMQTWKEMILPGVWLFLNISGVSCIAWNRFNSKLSTPSTSHGNKPLA